MKRFVSIVIIIFGLFACSPSTELESSNTRIKPEATATKLIPTATKTRVAEKPTATPILATEMPIPTATEIVSREEQELAAFPLSGRGPYWTGNRKYTFVDESRGGREIWITIWYPALKQTNADGNFIMQDAVPDMSAAPYPLILTEPNSGVYLFQSHLASHGFVMAIVHFPDNYDNWDFGVVDHPLDMLFALDQIASLPLEGLEGVIDSGHVGVAGYSWGGFYSLAVSGVRIDPSYYLDYCERASVMQPAIEEWYLKYICNLAQNWDEFAAHVGDEITVSNDGLWQPLTNERIQAVMPMAADGAWLYGVKGLSTADRPALFIQATEDSTYQPTEAAFIFEHLGTPERSMISFIGQGHMMVFTPKYANRMLHFATAFFGYHLQGRQDYADLFSEDFVAQFDDLAWGVYSDE